MEVNPLPLTHFIVTVLKITIVRNLDGKINNYDGVFAVMIVENLLTMINDELSLIV